MVTENNHGICLIKGLQKKTTNKSVLIKCQDNNVVINNYAINHNILMPFLTLPR